MGLFDKYTNAKDPWSLDYMGKAVNSLNPWVGVSQQQVAPVEPEIPSVPVPPKQIAPAPPSNQGGKFGGISHGPTHWDRLIPDFLKK